jgi:hypothetical protein
VRHSESHAVFMEVEISSNYLALVASLIFFFFFMNFMHFWLVMFCLVAEKM